MSGRKAAVGAVVLALAGGGVAAAAPTNYDISSDPTGAAGAMNRYCQPPADPSQPNPCAMEPGATVTNGLGPERALSDKVINCNTNDGTGLGEHALLASGETKLTDEVGQGTKLDLELEVDVKLGILKTSLSASTSQFEKVTTGMDVDTSVDLLPGYYGYVFAQWPTVTVTGTLTDGVNFTASPMTLTYPGYGNGDLSKVVTGTTAAPIKPDDKATCDKLTPDVWTGPSARGQRGLAISVCAAGGRKCRKRSLVLTNASRLLSGRASVMLDRGKRVYAIGTDRNGAIRLRAVRRLRAGAYRMFVNRPGRETMTSCVLH
jgi:hypothetical protein